MEHKLDELLKQLHRYLFADSEQVIIELRHYMLDRSLKEAELGKSSRIYHWHFADPLTFVLLYSFCLLQGIQLK